MSQMKEEDKVKDEDESMNSIDDDDVDDEEELDQKTITENEKKERKRIRELKKEQNVALDRLRKEQAEALSKTSSKTAEQRLKFLMAQTDLFAHFVSSGSAPPLTPQKKSGAKKKARLTEAEEDQQLLENEQHRKTSTVIHLDTQPHCIVDETGKGRRMRDYQIQGLNWMVNLYENGVNGILADEMGLGKTLQTISLLGYLKESRGINGPHIVIVPKSTIGNWIREFATWCPSLRVVKFHGDKAERARQCLEVVTPGGFDVVVTSYEIAIIEKNHLKKFAFRYLVIDEAHRIKNENSLLSQIVRLYSTTNRLLITGTPLQNNLRELWALLNFLLPDVFSSSEEFDEWFNLDNSETQQQVASKLHKVLRPFLLRRLKADVEKSLPPKKEIKLFIGMSGMQREWYQKLLLKDLETVNGVSYSKGSKVRLLNIVMQLRKCCNHPYLFEGAEQKDPETGEFTTDEHLVENSGKLVVLDKLLRKLKEVGSRVLIFSQMTRMLDILEDYLGMRDMPYCRIDGSTDGDDREEQIDAFNSDNSEKFVFLLSTRAGGLGINLATADTVVIYDSDWNPQADLQAQDRAHRIGQKKPVTVYRFVTEKTIEEKVVQKAEMKLHLDALVVQQGRLAEQHKGVGKEELLAMIRFGADEIFKSKEETLTDEDIDALINRGRGKTEELKKEMAEKFKDTDLSLASFKMAEHESVYKYEGQDYRELQKEEMLKKWIEPPKRERQESYNIDAYYSEKIVGKRKRKEKEGWPKAPPKRKAEEYQFFSTRYVDLVEKEKSIGTRRLELFEKNFKQAKEKAVKSKEPIPEQVALNFAQAEDAKFVAKPENIMTQKEKDDMERLSTGGFHDWKKSEFLSFIRFAEKHGRDDYFNIALDMQSKTEKEVKEYSKVFWQKHNLIKDCDKYIKRIEDGERKIKAREQFQNALTQKCASYSDPWTQLKLSYGANQGKHYINDEDRWLVCMANEVGYGNWDDLVIEAREAWQFRFDWFMKSRTAVELGRRVDSLIRLIIKEQDEEKKRKKSASSSASSSSTGAKKKKK